MKPRESLHRLDTQDIGYEMPAEKPEQLFDPKRDISPSDIAEVRASLQKIHEPGKKYYAGLFLDDGLALQVIDPTFQPSEAVGDREREEIRKSLKALRKKNEKDKNGDWDLFAHLADPYVRFDRHQHPETTINEVERTGIRKRLDYFRQEGQYFYFTELAGAWSRLDPSFNPQMEISDEDRQGMRQDINTWRRMGRWRSFAILVHNLARVDPSFHVHQEVTPADRTALAAELGKIQADKSEFRERELTLYIIALNDLSRDLEIPQLEPGPRGLPEVRKY